MIIPDINLLVYAYNSDAPNHARARQWWEEALSSQDTVGLPWVVCLGFLRLMTSRHVLGVPWDATEVLGQVRKWMARPATQLLQPGPRHLEVLESFARRRVFSSDLTTDAHLAVLAIEHQAELHSNDSDFERFPGLRWRNPLV